MSSARLILCPPRPALQTQVQCHVPGGQTFPGDRAPDAVVQSVRFSRELTERLMAEAARRDCTPSEVIRDLVEAGLAAVDESATVKLADVRRVIDALAQRAA